MTVIEKIAELRKLMDREHIDAYIIPTDDYHASEYVGAYFKEREYMTGFTGSAGTFVLTKDTAALWTDGRYFLQAKEQLAGSGIELMRSGQPGVPEISDYLAEHMPEGGVVGFDGRTVTAGFYEKLQGRLSHMSISYAMEKNLVDEIWTDRPQMSAEPVWELPLSYAGVSREEKLRLIREQLNARGADYLLLTSLDDIAWTLNLRGNDIAYTPVFLAYMLTDQHDAFLCINERICDVEIAESLKAAGVTMRTYRDITALLQNLAPHSSIMLDKSVTGISLLRSIPDMADIIDEVGPPTYLKMSKNPTEMEHIRQAHIKDGVAVTRFIYWLKTNVGRMRITELDASKEIDDMRAQMEGFVEPSFESIIAYGSHGAIVHYEPTEETDTELLPGGFVLADTGGHYLDGTTDITRTISLGALSDEEKRAYTLVLKGHLALAHAVFPKGATGENLDILARRPLWEAGMDFNHGTGHGVGYLLNVHEGPVRISWRIREGTKPVPLAEGMVISDEPGVYIAGKYGIRLENLLLCVDAGQGTDGQFMRFENLTLVPFDREAIVTELLDETERRQLNDYHERVWQEISPYLTAPERAWLRDMTSPIDTI